MGKCTLNVSVVIVKTGENYASISNILFIESRGLNRNGQEGN